MGIRYHCDLCHFESLVRIYEVQNLPGKMFCGKCLQLLHDYSKAIADDAKNDDRKEPVK